MINKPYEITCGIYLYDIRKDLFLIGHVTNAGKTFSIPKGLYDETDENFFSAAVRELQEETSIDHTTLNILYKEEYPTVDYKTIKKKFKSFLLVYDNGEETLKTECLSTFIDPKSKKEHLEIDYFLWITLNDASLYLSSIQLEHIKKIEEAVKIIKTTIK